MEHSMVENWSNTATFQYQELPYKSKAESNAYIYYTFGL